jgi:hypothetical protein
MSGGVKPDFTQINFPALAMPMGMQMNLKLMPGPAKFFIFVTAATIIIEALLRTWAIYSLNKAGATSVNMVWYWITSIISIFAAIVLAIFFVLIINSVYFAGHHTIAWILGLLPIIGFLTMLIISPTAIEVVLGVVSGKTLATVLSETFPNAATKLNEFIQAHATPVPPTPTE